MGFLNNNETVSAGSSDKLDLVEYESNFVKKFNNTEILNTKYKAEEFGLSFDKKKGSSDVYLYDGSEEIVICPEPLEFLKEFDDVSDNASKAHELFQKKKASFQRIRLDHVPKLKGTSKAGDGERMWMDKTLTGINLRPGNLNDDRDIFTPIRMCDDNVHGLIAGRTGSGKSVYINALILSLITEYSPWELNLYLADFKKVELSRYMNNADDKNGNTPFTPHINACAATSEIRYVISLIRYLVDCMNARQEFFARLGVTKIQEFRNRYGLVLPRVLLIVDEFQQLFTEATNREAEEIQTMLNSITKLGRATGFHLIFASQEMSGTLRGNTLANFKIRMCLPCNQQISTDILGNSEAVNLDRGYVLINTESGDVQKNQRYRVPFIETDKKDDDDDDAKTAFYVFLDEIKLAGKQYENELRYKTLSQKFYREELQETETAYRADLDAIKDRKNELVMQNNALFDAVILGKTVLYSPKPNDKVSFYIEKGRNKGIMIACPEPDNAARIRKLLTENLIRSNEVTYHFGMELNNLVFGKYRIDLDIPKSDIHQYYPCDVDDAIEFLELMYYLRTLSRKYVDNNSGSLPVIKSDEEDLVRLLRDPLKVEQYNKKKQMKQKLSDRLSEVDHRIFEFNRENDKRLASPIINFLEKCSYNIELIPTDHIKVNLTELNCYNDVVSAFSTNLDLIIASQRSLEILNTRIEALSKIECKNEHERNQKDLAILRNKIFKRAIMFFADRYEGKIPVQTTLSPVLEKIYSSVESAVKVYKKDYESKKDIADQLRKLAEEKQDIQNQISVLEAEPLELKEAEDRMMVHMNEFMSYIFDTSYTQLGYRKDKPLTPEVEYSFDGSSIRWELNGERLDEKTRVIAADVFDWFAGQYTGESSIRDFKKVVFWINGLDEIEKVPNQLIEIIRNAINQNILVISIITSELRDTLIRKAFDYAFITGNIEKFYSMFDIRYTKQPLDSIVVNFGIRSKGFDIPFKMYKSNLDEIQAPDFIERLLNA